MIFIDANVFMYAVGRESPYRAPSQRWLRDVAASGREPACTSAEVLQELLHRYRASGVEVAFTVFDAALALPVAVLPVGVDELRRARRILEAHPGLSTRDAVHAGVMEANGVSEVLSYDRDFDRIPWIRRREP